ERHLDGLRASQLRDASGPRAHVDRHLLAVRAKCEDLRPALPRDCGRLVDRAVVDDEDIDVGELVPQLVEHGRQVLLLVPRWDEDERVAHFGKPARSNSARAARSWRDRTVRAPSSQATADGVGTTGATRNVVAIPCA